MKTYDIVVVGAGPAGLSVAIEAGKNNLSCLLIDKGSLVNTIRKYPTYSVFFSTSELLELGGVPFPAVSKQPTRQEALRYYTKLVEYFKLEHSLYNTVEKIEKVDKHFMIKTTKGMFEATQVVVAIGYYDKYNKLNVPGEDLPNVSHYYIEPYPYVGRKVVVVGGSNSAGEAALDLYRNGAEVTMVHRGAELYYKMKYWVRPDLENRIKEGSIKAYFNSTVLEILPEKMRIETPDGQKEIDAQHVLALTGYHPDVSFLSKTGVLFDPETYVPQYNAETLESNIAGLYLAGTVLTGKNTSKIFIENSRHHGKLIVADILKKRNA
ncbi:YpdA family putative bacillithiol disulfide reductase [bacterium]|nr:YpdA family putative bacillithiol disulfide reductase [bacterium]